MPDIAGIVVAVCVALYFAIRLTLRYYFPPMTVHRLISDIALIAATTLFVCSLFTHADLIFRH